MERARTLRHLHAYLNDQWPELHNANGDTVCGAASTARDPVFAYDWLAVMHVYLTILELDDRHLIDLVKAVPYPSEALEEMGERWDISVYLGLPEVVVLDESDGISQATEPASTPQDSVTTGPDEYEFESVVSSMP